MPRFSTSGADRDELRRSFAIDVGGEAVGSIGLVPGVDIERYSAEVGYWLGTAYWRQGIATAAVRRVVRYAFEELRMTRVFATPMVWNPASCRSASEGRIRARRAHAQCVRERRKDRRRGFICNCKGRCELKRCLVLLLLLALVGAVRTFAVAAEPDNTFFVRAGNEAISAGPPPASRLRSFGTERLRTKADLVPPTWPRTWRSRRQRVSQSAR